MIIYVIKVYNEVILEMCKNIELKNVYAVLEKIIPPEFNILKLVIPSTEYMLTYIGNNFEPNPAHNLLTSYSTVQITENIISIYAMQPKIILDIIIGNSYYYSNGLSKRKIAYFTKVHIIEEQDNQELHTISDKTVNESNGCWKTKTAMFTKIPRKNHVKAEVRNFWE